MTGEHPLKIGKYDVVSVLGEGGMGVVYKARDSMIDRIVAIKTIRGSTDFSDESLVARLTQEAKAAGRLQHPNIVTIYDFGQQDELTYLAMEYVEGSNLARVIAKRTPISLTAKVDIIIQICQGLAYAHEIGVFHRDIKPANICLTSNGTPKILDFGLARFDETRLTKTGFTSGTVSYMSPERMRGKSGPHDDIFALGAVAYEILTSRNAFPGKTYKEVVTKILSDEYPIPPSEVANLPKAFDEIILKAVARKIEDRYANAAEMARDLERLRNSSEFVKMVSGDSLGSTTEQPIPVFDGSGSGAHPYSAGEIERAESGETAAGPDQPTIQTAVQPESVPPGSDLPTDQYVIAETEVTAEQPNDTPRTVVGERRPDEEAPPTEKWDSIHLEKTEKELPPVRRDQAPEPLAKRTEVAKARPEPTPAHVDPTPQEKSDSSGSVVRTKVALPGDRPMAMQPPSPEPVGPAEAPPPVTPIAEPTEIDADLLREQREEAEPAVVSRFFANPFIPLTVLLFAATFAATFAANLVGTFAFLVAYAIAAVIWTFVVRSAPRLTFERILMIAVLLRLLCFFAAPALSNDVYRFQWDGLVASAEMNPWTLAPSNEALQPLRGETFDRIDQPDVPSNRPPLTVLVSLVWSWTGSSLPIWRVALLGFDLLIVWLLWSPKAPRRSLAWATMPFVALEGVWGGHIELVAAALLVATFAIASKQKEIGSGAMLGFAAGTSLLPVAALPALGHTVNRRITPWLGFLVVVLVPYLFVGFGSALFDPLTRAVGQSPTLSLAQGQISGVFERTNFAAKFAEGWQKLSTRAGLERFDDWVATHLDAPALAGITIAIAVLVILSFVAMRSRTNETAFANCLGLALVVSFAVDPWYWLLVIPFGLISNRPLWVLFALFSPALYLASSQSGEVNWLVYGVSYIMPILALIGAKISRKDGGRSAFDFR